MGRHAYFRAMIPQVISVVCVLLTLIAFTAVTLTIFEIPVEVFIGVGAIWFGTIYLMPIVTLVIGIRSYKATATQLFVLCSMSFLLSFVQWSITMPLFRH